MLMTAFEEKLLLMCRCNRRCHARLSKYCFLFLSAHFKNHTKFKQITDSNHVSQNSLDIRNTRASGMYFITCSKPCTYLIQYVVKRKSTGAINLAGGDKSISFCISRGYCVCQSRPILHQRQRSELD